MAKKQFIEHVQYDNEAFAREIYEDSERRLQKNTRGIIFGLICSVLWLVMEEATKACATDVANRVALIELPFIIVCWFLCIFSGGISGSVVILKLGWKIATIGWWIVPYFPMDLFVFLITVAFAFGGIMYAFVFAPWILQLLARIQLTADRNDAASYLDYCQYVRTNQNGQAGQMGQVGQNEDGV